MADTLQLVRQSIEKKMQLTAKINSIIAEFDNAKHPKIIDFSPTNS